MAKRSEIKTTIDVWILLLGGIAPQDQNRFTESLMMLWNNLEALGVTEEQFRSKAIAREIIQVCVNPNWKGGSIKKWRYGVEKKFEKACLIIFDAKRFNTELTENQDKALKGIELKAELAPVPEEKPKKRKRDASDSIEDSPDFKPIDRSKLEPTGIELPSIDEWEKEFMGDIK